MPNEFNLEITPTPKYLANKLKLTMPYSYYDFHNELLNEPWTLPVVNVWQNRYKSYRPVSPMLQELAGFLSSDETKRKFISAVYQGSKGLFPTRWGMSEEELFKVTSLHAEFTKDTPGFVQNIHLDYKLLVLTGMIFFSPKDDPAISTVYYETPDGEGAMRMAMHVHKFIAAVCKILLAMATRVH